MPGAAQARRFFVSGQVQGVGFRFFACHVAERLGIAGYVRNLVDGRVEAYAVGGAAQMDLFTAELRRGPRHANCCRSFPPALLWIDGRRAKRGNSLGELAE
jgi:acylphosphatase